MTSKTFVASAAFGLMLGSSVLPIWAAECTPDPRSKALAHATLLSSANTKSQGEVGALLNFDRYRKETATALAPVPTSGFEGRHQSALFDRRMGVATFLWAKTDAAPIAVGALTSREQLIARARAHLKNEAASLKLTDALIDEAFAADAQYNGNGPAVVRFKQRVAGKEVYGRSMNVLLDRSGKPIAVSGYFATDFSPASINSLRFNRSAAQAVSSAWSSLGAGLGLLDAALLRVAAVKGEYEWFATPALSGSQVLERMPRAKAIYYPRAGRLEPAYYVELFSLAKATKALSAFALVVSATDGSILNRRDLVSHAEPFNYRVFADGASNGFQPYDSPLGNAFTPFPGAAPSDKIARVTSVTADLIPVASLTALGVNDPWLPDDATTTVGNNTDACIDAVDSPTSGLLSVPLTDPLLNTCIAAVGDIRPELTGPRSFDYALAPDEDPANDNARLAAAVNLFYINNWLHDWWYVHGFNEEAGNAQTSNLGRGGEEGDPILAQGQDGSGRGNANMATPADGSSPRMQQYLFDGVVKGVVRQVAPVMGEPLLFGAAAFGPPEYDLAATPVVLAADSSGEPADGCGPALPVPDPTGLGVIPGIPAPPQASLAGAIALIDRGSCSFTVKARFAQLSGAVGMVVVNNTDGDPISMGNADIPISVPLPVSTSETYTTPSVMIRKADGAAIKAQIAAGVPVTMSLQREATTDLDGTLDNQIVAHEFFHYVHNRLAVVGNQQASSMGEGWGDIDAFMFAARPEDRLLPGNDKFQGAYNLAGYVVNNFYNGIRRIPYSTDMAKNGFTLKHIADGTPTPDGGLGATNSAVHSSGEVWANQMWECYVGLLNDPRHSFTEAQNRMKDYIIGGLKMTPDDATFTEARDAVLSVVLARDYLDYEVCSNGFAKRGNGLNAVAPDRDSADHVGVTEDFTPFVCKASTPVTPTNPAPTDPTPTTPVTPVNPAPVAGGADGGRFGGGALHLVLLLPLLGIGLLRRRRSLRLH